MKERKPKELLRPEDEDEPPGTPLFRFPDENTWQEVVPRKERKKANKAKKPPASVTKTQTTVQKQGSNNKLRRSRSEAVLIKPAEDKTYANMLQKIKDSVDPSTTETLFKTIRCTRGGEVLLELQSTQNKTQFSDEVRRAVESDAADVRDSISKTTLEIRDIDACATEDEVRQAIAQAGVGGDILIRLTDANNRGQRLAIATAQET